MIKSVINRLNHRRKAMTTFKWFQNLVEYIEAGVQRIFSPSDDDYPSTGAVPFEGDPNKEKSEKFQ